VVAKQYTVIPDNAYMTFNLHDTSAGIRKSTHIYQQVAINIWARVLEVILTGPHRPSAFAIRHSLSCNASPKSGSMPRSNAEMDL
jgi:hypothetical protein